MSEFRCFDTFTSDNFSSSDYIKKRKRKTLFTNAQTISIGNSNYQKGITENAIPPGYMQKEDGGGTFFNPVYVGTTESSSRCLIGAHSYDVLYDVLYGAPLTKDKVDRIKNGDTKALVTPGDSWIGNIMEIDFKVSNGYPNGSKIGPAITTHPNGVPNKMHYPARQDFLPKYDEDPYPPDDFPGMVIDPCYNIFYPQCPSKYKTNNYAKNVRYNRLVLLNSLSKQETFKFISNKLYQNVEKFPYPLDFSATSCIHQKL